MYTNFVMNGQGVGPVGEVMHGVRFEPSLMQPFLDSNGVPCVRVPTGQYVANAQGILVPKYAKQRIVDVMARGVYSPVFNATMLTKEAWIQLDQAVMRAARLRLRAWTDLVSASSYGGFNAMAKMTLEYQAMSDPGSAQVDMDGLGEGSTDSPLFSLRSLPLPITHANFGFSQRELAVSRNGGAPLDTVMAEAAGQRVAEMVEKTVIGLVTGTSYGYQSSGVNAHESDTKSNVYGYLNFPKRLTKTGITQPTGSNPEATVADVLSMREQLFAQKFYGPFMLYHSTDWDQYLDNDYARLGGNNASMTLRDRLRAIEGIQDVRRLDYLTSDTNPYTLLMVQMTGEVARAIVGMNITTMQWESLGGLRTNFKVMAILVPQLRYDYNDCTGILEATVAA